MSGSGSAGGAAARSISRATMRSLRAAYLVSNIVSFTCKSTMDSRCDVAVPRTSFRNSATASRVSARHNLAASVFMAAQIMLTVWFSPWIIPFSLMTDHKSIDQYQAPGQQPSYNRRSNHHNNGLHPIHSMLPPPLLVLRIVLIKL